MTQSRAAYPQVRDLSVSIIPETLEGQPGLGLLPRPPAPGGPVRIAHAEGLGVGRCSPEGLGSSSAGSGRSHPDMGL